MRTRNKISLALTTVATVSAALAAPVFGQGLTFTQASFMGEIVGGRGLDIYLKANNGNAVVASLDPKARLNGFRPQNAGTPHVEVTGEIRGEHLTKGMSVRFRAKVQGRTRRRTVDPVKKFEVFTPDQATKFGLITEGLGDDEAKKAQEDADAVHDYLVVGIITSVRGNTIAVEFPRTELKGSVTATLAEDALVDVKVNQLIAPVGAQISVEGWIIQGLAQQPIKMLATNVQIQLPPPPPPKNKIARAQPPKKGDQPADGADPFAAGGADAGNPPQAGEPEQVIIPGEIIKLN